jgi:hypothetical protein
MARCVWALTEADIVEHISLSSEPSAKTWLFSMIETMKADDLTRMLVTLWAIWHAKRKAIHEEIFQSPMATIGFVNRFLVDIEAGAEVKNSKKGSNTTSGRKSSWIAPPVGRAKINVDAAVARSVDRGAVAAVCRSRDGTFMGAAATVYDGISHPGTLEALACREALDVAADLLLGPILVASDCLEVVKGLHEENAGVFGIILREVKDRSKRRGNTTFIHERREANVEAHRLARFASSLPVGRHVWLTEPPVGLNMPVTLNFSE